MGIKEAAASPTGSPAPPLSAIVTILEWRRFAHAPLQRRGAGVITRPRTSFRGRSAAWCGPSPRRSQRQSCVFTANITACSRTFSLRPTRSWWKAAFALLGRIAEEYRLPLVPMSPANRKLLESLRTAECVAMKPTRIVVHGRGPDGPRARLLRAPCPVWLWRARRRQRQPRAGHRWRRCGDRFSSKNEVTPAWRRLCAAHGRAPW